MTKMNTEINKLAIWFRANKMCVTVAKIKYIIFRTRGKYINENIEPLMFNANEPGQPVDAILIYRLERIHDNHTDKNMSLYKLP